MTELIKRVALPPCPFCQHATPSVSDGNNGLHFRVICGNGNCRAAGPLERCAADAESAWRCRVEATHSTALLDGEYEQALKDILNPIGRLRRLAEQEGNKLGPHAYMVANDIGYLRSIAREALNGNGSSVSEGEGL